MKRVALVHWNRDEARALAKRLGESYRVSVVADAAGVGRLLRDAKKRGPAAFIIDLSRVPSQGRDLALAFRESKSTRSIPVVFAAGDPKKVAAIKKLLPDAT